MKQRYLSPVLGLLVLLFFSLSQGPAAAEGERLSKEGVSILAHYDQGAALPDDERVMALHGEMEALLAKVEGKNDVSKVVILHDLLIQNTEMDYIAAGTGMPTSAYDALVGKWAADDGYAEALHLLYTAADVENVLVQARLKLDASPHR